MPKPTVTNHSYLQETISLREELEGAFLILAERLYKIREERLWEGEYVDFNEFIRETRLSKATVSKLTGIYEKFILLGGIPREEVAKTGWSNISLFLPMIQSKKDARDIFDKIAPLDRTDCERTYREMKSGVSMGECKHGDIYTLDICRDCGIKMEHHE